MIGKHADEARDQRVAADRLPVIDLDDKEPKMPKVLAVLFPDPVGGQPTEYARDTIPDVSSYPDGMEAPAPVGRRLHPR